VDACPLITGLFVQDGWLFVDYCTRRQFLDHVLQAKKGSRRPRRHEPLDLLSPRVQGLGAQCRHVLGTDEEIGFQGSLLHLDEWRALRLLDLDEPQTIHNRHPLSPLQNGICNPGHQDSLSL
jgi:hypothetical protein